MNRKQFIGKSLAGAMGLFTAGLHPDGAEEACMMTVTGKTILANDAMVLCHEHITTDFTGAEKIPQPQYDRTEAFNTILPAIKKLGAQGVALLVECTPAYIGRDVQLLKLLSLETGVKIMTNTGYYAAAGHKFLPQYAFTENEEALASRFLKEWTEGIDGTGIRPGFIKLGIDKAPLEPVEKKIIRAAAMVHLQTGMKIAIHSGNAAAAVEEFELLASLGVAPEAFIWVHAQNDTSGDTQLQLAKKGCFISLDNVNTSARAIENYGALLIRHKKNNSLNKVLLSHDDGFAVNKNQLTGKIELDLFQNGNGSPYQAIFTALVPYLLKSGFSADDISQLLTRNPKEAYSIKTCPL